MASLNDVRLIGYLGADPEVRYLPGGECVASIRLATTECWRDRDTGELRKHTEWHRVVFFGEQAEIVGKHLRSGSQIYVQGSLRTRKWRAREGHDRYATEIRAPNMQRVDRRVGDHAEPSPEPAPAEAPEDAPADSEAPADPVPA